MISQISQFSYISAALAFAFLLGMLLTVWRERVRGSILTLACLVTFGWAVFLATTDAWVEQTVAVILVVEILRDCAWLIFLSSLLARGIAAESNWLVRHGGVALGLALLAASSILAIGTLGETFRSITSQLLILGSIGLSLFGIIGVEQLYRNVRRAQQSGLKYLCLGLMGIFAFDLFVYSNAVVAGQINAKFWSIRGFVAALSVPLIAISVQRIQSWRRGIFASRQIVFYATTLIAAGFYLSVVGLAGFYVQALDETWGGPLRLVFVVAAIIALVVLIMSDRLRALVRIWIAKHFFEGMYDYRVEWLRLNRTLTTTDDQLPLKKRSIKALSDIVDSPSGHLWLRSEDGQRYTSASSWDVQPLSASFAADSNFVEFIAKTGWVIDLRELKSQPDKYLPLIPSDVPSDIFEAAYVVPLLYEQEMIGCISLSTPRVIRTLTYEDHDLLKIAGQQVASYLTREAATERLAESLQFEAYNRFTAFIMHDLKNAIAQQSLVVENAERHKRNPEFIDDAMETIKGSVSRMRRLMGHLRQSANLRQSERVDMTKVLLEVTSQCADRNPEPRLSAPDSAVFVRGIKERLASAIVHAIRNAQDASGDDGEVFVDLDVFGDECCIQVRDTGHGMDSRFVQERLFKPFDSTKGSEGMGIGAYQIREAFHSSGGRVDVQSEVDVGTTIKMQLPVLSAVEQ